MNKAWEQRLGFLNRIHWEKTVIWSLFLLFVYIISDFFGLFFITFILSYIFHHLTRWTLARFFQGSTRAAVRISVVTFLYLLLVGGMVGLMVLIGPGVYQNAAGMVAKVESLEAGARIEKEITHALAGKVGPKHEAEVEGLVKRLLRYPPDRKSEARTELEEFLRGKRDVRDKPIDPGFATTRGLVDGVMVSFTAYHEKRGIRNALMTFLTDTFEIEKTPQVEKVVAEGEGYLMEHWPTLVAWLRSFLASIFKGMIHMFLAVIFSYLILLDLPRIGRLVESMAAGRTARFYEEIKPTMIGFASVIGRAFQAQTVIAFLNTAFTFVGMRILGIEHVEVLSIIVFLCSFVPVAGVFISTTPMVLVALQMEGGSVTLGLYIIGLVTIIHMLEAYVFNPRIMGEFLHMHPLFVLLILVVAEHFFHIWGLLLGVPVVYYLFAHVLKGEGKEGKEEKDAATGKETRLA